MSENGEIRTDLFEIVINPMWPGIFGRKRTER